MHHPTDRIAHTMSFVIPVLGALAGMRNGSESTSRDLSDDPLHHDCEQILYHGATACSCEKKSWEHISYTKNICSEEKMQLYFSYKIVLLQLLY